MKVRCADLSLLFLLVTAGHAATGQEPASRQDETLFLIPHTHWEGAVFKTREEYLPMGFPNILQALHLLRTYPEYRFTLDQVAYFRPFLERYPEQAAAFRQFIAEGRLQIVGGMDVMPDDVKPGGELFIRQLQYGKRYCREALGVDVTVGWFLDTFGHHPQMPQLLKLAGYQSFWFCRGVPHDRLPSEFRWEGIDGSQIPAYWLPGFYGLFYDPPKRFPEFANFFQQRFDSLTPHVRGPERVGLAGADVSEPEESAPPLVARFNRQTNAPFFIRYAVPSDFEAVVAKRENPPVVRADFNPIFPGTYSSRIELKQLTREIESDLLAAEKLRALTRWMGSNADDTELWRAWEPVLFNQTHDLASGVMTDHVYEDTLASYRFAERLTQSILQEDWGRFVAQIDTRGPGLPIVVFNPLGWPRTDIVELDTGVTEAGITAFEVTDTDGASVPAQIVSSDQYENGGLRQVKLAFLARQVPAMGFAVYHVKPASASKPVDTAPAPPKEDVIENEDFRARFNLATGELLSLYDKSAQWEVLARPGNIVAREEDKGDLWELGHGLDGGSYIAGTNRQDLPTAPAAVLSSAFSGTNGTVRRGPVFSEFSVSHALGDGSFATRVRLYRGLRRLDIQTELVNRQKYVRYQALFPSSIRDGRYYQEIPFGAVPRPSGIEFPAQHWVDYGDDQHGVALLNFGLPGNVEIDGTLLVSLMRSENLGHYGYGGGYEPGMSSETGFELDRPLTFRYALLPHQGSWQKAAIPQAGLEWNHPLVVRKAATHPGTLGKRWGFLEISQANVLLSSVQPGHAGGLIVRVYEANGDKASGVRLRFPTKIASARVINLLEDPQKPLVASGDALELDLHPFEIKTVQLQLQPMDQN